MEVLYYDPRGKRLFLTSGLKTKPLTNIYYTFNINLIIYMQDSTESETAGTALEATGDSNVDNLLHVINYLRKEKNLANSQLEVFSSENRRCAFKLASLHKCR